MMGVCVCCSDARSSDDGRYVMSVVVMMSVAGVMMNVVVMMSAM